VTQEGVELPLGPGGAERAEFVWAANPGERLEPLSDAASGGEWSRVMLALHVVAHATAFASTVVFDEIDAGVGGAAADAVGTRLAQLAQRRQVLCVTHLPQVAAYADRHLRVRKEVRAGRAHAMIEDLAASGRIEEVARMLGGKCATAASRRHAAELLGAAGQRPARRNA
jgi:DNA repair protein RecN (Recombination protein N)